MGTTLAPAPSINFTYEAAMNCSPYCCRLESDGWVYTPMMGLSLTWAVASERTRHAAMSEDSTRPPIIFVSIQEVFSSQMSWPRKINGPMKMA